MFFADGDDRGNEQQDDQENVGRADQNGDGRKDADDQEEKSALFLCVQKEKCRDQKENSLGKTFGHDIAVIHAEKTAAEDQLSGKCEPQGRIVSAENKEQGQE